MPTASPPQSLPSPGSCRARPCSRSRRAAAIIRSSCRTPSGQPVGGGGKQVQDERLKDGRLTNVTPTISNFDKLDAADASVDVVTWFQGPHELWCIKDCGGPLGDPADSFAELSRVLKPGGYLVIMDHVAPQGTPTTSGDTTHRVDPMQIKALATGANFALEEESNILANPADDHTKGVFDPAIRGKTDQVLLRYKKP
jgi:predicted methyltransferase